MHRMGGGMHTPLLVQRNERSHPLDCSIELRLPLARGPLAGMTKRNALK